MKLIVLKKKNGTKNHITKKNDPIESSNQEHCFAPGEVKYPSDILMDKSWDINAFPLFHTNGKFGLNEKTEIIVRLTEQNSFKQRKGNKNSQFIDNKAYLYSDMRKGKNCPQTYFDEAKMSTF